MTTVPVHESNAVFADRDISHITCNAIGKPLPEKLLSIIPSVGLPKLSEIGGDF